MIRAGQLRHRVQLQSPTRTAGTYGHSRPTSWTTYANTWASVEDLSGTELLEASQLQSDITTRVRMRHRTNIDTEDRIIHGSRTLEIISILDAEGRRRQLEVLCAEAAD